MLSDGESHVWVDQDRLGSWTIKLGMDGSTGIALDWTVAVSVTAAPAGKQVHLETTEYLTRDGALVNAKAHQRLRETLQEALPGLRPADLKPELAVSTAGLERPAPSLTVEELAASAGDYLLETALAREVVLERLTLLHFPRSGHFDAEVGPWRVGLDDGGPVGLVSASVLPDRAGRLSVRLSAALPGPDLGLRRAIAVRQYQRLVALAHSVLLRQDDTATLTDLAAAGTAR